MEELGYSQLEEGLTGYGRESRTSISELHENFQCRSNGRRFSFFKGYSVSESKLGVARNGQYSMSMNCEVVLEVRQDGRLHPPKGYSYEVKSTYI